MISKILVFALTSLGITFAIALGLILSQRPAALPAGEGLDFSNILGGRGIEPMPQISVPMRDGFPLQVRHYPTATPDAPLLVLVHGSGWHGMQFDGLARRLGGQAEVLVPDLRGHGAQPGERGDIAYIGQFEDDLADLLAAYQADERRVFMAGHSSGGGLVIRFAGGAHGSMLDGAVLMAPFLKHNAPTTRPNSGGWAYVLTRRIIGLSMLNTFRIRALNHLMIIQFRMPQAVMDGPLGHTATTAYSYRLNTSFAPRSDYLADIAALPPFVLIAGDADEAFYADRYEPTMNPANPNGRYVLVPGLGHFDVVNAPETAQIMESLLDDL
jgi:alpha-beta hydrolase superfamily lysophospholipase